ncbi:MAG: family 20 glycosylhydrolase [Longimicrobiales bacterium]|nr:family 20 glycosylhydrolase [Longimicrobiales bacterium]
MSRTSSPFAALFAVLLAACATGAPPALPPVIPRPLDMVSSSGAFALGPATRVLVAPGSSAEAGRIAAAWSGQVRETTGRGLEVSTAPCARGAVCLRVTEAGPAEGYALAVTKDSVVVSGNDHAGLFYGLQTLSQMLPPRPDGASAARIPAVTVTDAPRFPYRGMHLDVGRHFFGPDFVKRYIDQLARYKINRFHWHLTEDQGWRIEIDRYPRLTEVGAWRRETMVAKSFDPFVGDGQRYGGFYTKDEIRDVVAYARERYVTIVPEIELPGHSLAALAAYPELGCTAGPFEVGTRWGIFEDIFCPKEETFAFLEGVLTEVMELFPGEYVHIGGDEAPKARWEASQVAQDVIRREGLADEHELQSWFIRRIERFLNANGRRLIGWDEILEGGLAPNATVMSWRGTQGGIDAARQGHDVVMTPTSHMYFDFYQGDPAQEPLAIGGNLPLERVYAFEPVPEDLTPAEGRRVLGAQGNVWTEYMLSEDQVEYMVFPRVLALSEVVWSPAGARDFDAFAHRLPWHFERLDASGIRYRIPDVLGLERDRLTLDEKVEVALAAPARGAIRYTLDGTEPTAGSTPYGGPLEVDVEEGPVTVAARIYTAEGAAGPVRRATFTRTAARPAALVDAALEPGFLVDLFQGSFRRVADLERRGLESVRREKVEAVVLPLWAPEEGFGLRFRGYLSIPEDGVYTFRVTADDAAVVRFAGATVLDHDGSHTSPEKEGQAALAQGLHPIEILYFQAGGGRALKLEWAGPDGAFAPVDSGAVSRVR